MRITNAATGTSGPKSPRWSWEGQSGAVLPALAIGMVVFLGFTALALDIGHLVSVKSELQKAADAGALAGARALAGSSPSQIVWGNGIALANQAVKNNKADGSLLTHCQVQAGYWSLSWSLATAPDDLQSQAIIPTSLDVPAVKVTVSKDTGANGGPVPLTFAPILGVNQSPVIARAVAIIGSPYAVPPGGLFPLAIKEDTVKNYDWNNHPTLRIDDPHDTGDAGWWTTFLQSNPSDSYIKDLIAGPSNGGVASPPLKVGDSIYCGDNIDMAPGVRAVNFGDALQYWTGKVVLLPVIPGDEPWGGKDQRPVKSFVPFKITGGSQGGKYLNGIFISNYVAPGSVGGPSNGAYVCKLVY
jgi:Flp pilus assembly protein TadG